MKEKLCVSYSGGETSGCMTTNILKRYSEQYDILITFANTGEENEETLIFVNKCDKYWKKHKQTLYKALSVKLHLALFVLYLYSLTV